MMFAQTRRTFFQQPNIFLYNNLARGFASQYSDPTNPRVFMDITRNGEDLGRLTFEVSTTPLFSHFRYSSSPTRFPRQPKTLGLSALEITRTSSLIRARPSTESSPTSWPKVVISLMETAPVDFLSTEQSSQTKTSTSSTLRGDNFLWRMQAKTLMDLSSLSPLFPASGLMELTSSLERWKTVKLSWRKSRPEEAGPAKPTESLRCQTAAW